MARSPSGRRGRGPSDLGGTLGSLLRSTWEQAGAVREVIERAAGTGRARIDEALTDRKRTNALVELGEIVLELVRNGELDLDELPEIRSSIDALDRIDAAAEAPGDEREGRAGRTSVWGSRAERAGRDPDEARAGARPGARFEARSDSRFDDRDVRELGESLRARDDRSARDSRTGQTDRGERPPHAHGTHGTHGAHGVHSQRENFPRFVPRPSLADRRAHDERAAAAAPTARDPYDDELEDGDELEDEYEEYDPAPDDSPSLDVEELTSPESPFASGTRRLAATQRLRATAPPRRSSGDDAAAATRPSHDAPSSGRVRAVQESSGAAPSRALDGDHVEDPPPFLDEDEAILSSDLPTISPVGSDARPAARSGRVTAPFPVSELREAESRGQRLRPADTRPGRPAHLRRAAAVTTPAADDDGTVSSASWKRPAAPSAERSSSQRSSSESSSPEPAAALVPAPSPGRAAQDIPGVVRFDDLPGAADLQAAPAKKLRSGGISFDDDDLDEYMHPDDVPRRPER